MSGAETEKDPSWASRHGGMSALFSSPLCFHVSAPELEFGWCRHAATQGPCCSVDGRLGKGRGTEAADASRRHPFAVAPSDLHDRYVAVLRGGQGNTGDALWCGRRGHVRTGVVVRLQIDTEPRVSPRCEVDTLSALKHGRVCNPSSASASASVSAALPGLRSVRVRPCRVNSCPAHGTHHDAEWGKSG